MPIDNDECGERINDFEDFIAAARTHFHELDGPDSAFISGESLNEALRRWWGEVLGMVVVAESHYKIDCPGCANRITVEKFPLYTLPMFDFAIWDVCPHCSKHQ